MSTSTHRWDEFSKSLADDSVPRRESLRWLGAALAGVVLSPLGLKPAWAGPNACKKFCQCRKKKDQAQCLAACKACDNRPNNLCGSCGSYFCCGNDTACCGDYCADLASDFSNCGECGFVCEEPGPYEYGECIDAGCAYGCVEGATVCDGQCTPLDQDPNNCGACGNVCEEPTPYCSGGVCTGCPGGTTLCGETCVYLDSDLQNCGACGNACEGGEECYAYECHPAAPPGDQ